MFYSLIHRLSRPSPKLTCLHASFSDDFSTERHNSHEEGGFAQRRGLRSFSSARESSKKGDPISFVTSPTERPEKTFTKKMGGGSSNVSF